MPDLEKPRPDCRRCLTAVFGVLLSIIAGPLEAAKHESGFTAADLHLSKPKLVVQAEATGPFANPPLYALQAAEPQVLAAPSTPSKPLSRFIIEMIVTVAGFTIAAWAIVWQMARQHRNSIELQKKNKRAEMRSEIYAILLDRLRPTENAQVEASTFVRMLPLSLRSYRYQKARGLNPAPVRERLPELLRLDGDLRDRVIHLFDIFESYAIVAPGFVVFQVALSAALHDLNDAFQPLRRMAMRVLPIDLVTYIDSNAGTAPRPIHALPPLSDQEFVRLDQLVENYLQAVQQLSSYIHDLRVEAQNLLLRPLYPDQQAPRRKPIDPRHKVITLENAEELIAFFRTETPWGQSEQQSNDDVRREVAARRAGLE